MCGIVGVLGNHEAAPLLVEALKRLEYRGYDSAGIATVNAGRLDRRRAVGKLVNLSDLLVHNPLAGKAGIGHTRWATHGAATVTNSTVADNVSARAGGGVEVAGGTADLADVELNRNSTGVSPGNGGGLHLGGASVVTIDASQVLANHAANEGGGLWNSPAGTLTVTNTSVTSNTVGVANNGPNVFQKGPVATGVFTVGGTPIPVGPNTLAFG